MKQHPDLSTLMSYSSGTLSLAFSTLVTSHIETCDHCKEIVQIGNELGASMMENDIGNKDKTEDFNEFLNKLNNKSNKSEIKEIDFDHNSEVPASLQRYIGTDLDEIQWSFFAPGIQKSQVKISDKSNCHLTFLKIKPNKKIPEHGHKGGELTLVLKGAFEDENGTYAAGDIADHDKSTHHEPVVSSKEDCICVIATDGPMVFKSMIANMYQSIVRI